MQQILFRIPFVGWPIYGYGFMLCCAFIGCTWLATRLARRINIPQEPIQDLSVWLFFTGIFGARIAFIWRYWDQFTNIGQFFAVWDGGLIFYGSIPGAVVGYVLCYRRQLSKFGPTHWQMADVVAPCLALGLCLGRLGCLLNGCCYGNVACASCPALSFPLSSPPRFEMVRRGHQTPAGFVTDPKNRTTVAAVEPKSPFAQALQPGDTITQIESQISTSPVRTYGDLVVALGPERPLEDGSIVGWRRGERLLTLVVNRNGEEVSIGPCAPGTIGLHPTQIYESISMGLLLFFLLSYYPYRRRDGSLMVWMMLAYAVHRFLNEMLRTDTEIVAFGMTLSQNISVAVFLSGIVLAVIVCMRPARALAA